MFDFHLHCNLSFDSDEDPRNYLLQEERLRLKEICFTDHYDYNSDPNSTSNLFSIENYKNTFDSLHSSKVSVRKEIEFGLTRWNQGELDQILAKYSFDFVLDSVHFVDGYDSYEQQYWVGCNVDDAFKKYLHFLRKRNQHADYSGLGCGYFLWNHGYYPDPRPCTY